MKVFYAILAGIGLASTIHTIVAGEALYVTAAYAVATAWFTFRTYWPRVG